MSSNLPTIEQALHIAGGGGTVGHTESNGKARRLAKELKNFRQILASRWLKTTESWYFTHEGGLCCYRP